MFKLVMNAALALGGAVAALPVHAQDVGAPPAAPGGRILSDPTYLPLHGQLFGDTTYGYAWSHVASATDAGPRSSGDGHSSTITQSLLYGLTDDLALSASDSYQWGRTARNSASAGEYVTHRDGFNDPTFGATWRVLDELRRSPVDLDLSASYSPDIIRSEAAGSGDTGSVARGGDAVTLRGAVGYVMPYVTVQGIVQGTHFGRADTDRDVGGSVDQSSYWQPSVGVRTQFRTRSPLSFNVDGTYDFRTHSDYVATPAETAYRVEGGRRGIIGALANYQFVPNRVVGSIGYDHTFKSTSNTDFAMNARPGYETRRSANGATASLLYAF